MANDLSNLDENEPSATDPVSEGDDKIRQTRLHLKTWAAVEHDPTGPHKFKYGNQAAKPAAGIAGRIFFDTILGRGEIDGGSQWNQLHCVQIGRGSTDAQMDLTSSYQTVQTVNMSLANYPDIVALGQVTLVSSTGDGDYDVYMKVMVDGNNADYEMYYHWVNESMPGFGTIFTIPAVYTSLVTGGSKDIVLQLKATVVGHSGTLRCSYRKLYVLAV